MQRLLISITLIIQTLLLSAQVGTWKAYMAYYDVTDVQKAGNTLYVLASNSLYTYNTNDQSIQTYDKTNGMSDCEIKAIAWCQSAKSLFIAYSNGNFDIMDANGNITNLPDYYSKVMTEDKTIYSIDIDGKYAYVSTGFGIVKVDVSNASISETYNLGFRVDYSYISGSNIYAASSTNGIYTASLTQSLQDPTSWTYSTTYTASTKTVDLDLLALAKTLKPGGPKYNYFNYMYFKNNRLYTTGGGWTTGTEYFRPGCVQVLEDKEWTIYQDDFTLPHDVKYQDNTSLAVDPTDPNHVFVSNVHCGLLEFKDGKYITNYNYDNSPILSVFTDNPNYIRTDGLIYKNYNLYLLNSSSKHAIIVYSKEKEWSFRNFEALFSKKYGVSLGIMRRTIIDSKGFIWFINDHSDSPSLFKYDTDNDTLVSYDNLYNQDGTIISTNGITCVTEDKDNNIWIGTDVGAYLLTQKQISDKTLGYTQIKVSRNDGTNLADYLLANVHITSIAVDGAGRKWFGTLGDGVYLISKDNSKQIYHYNMDNSKLLSNNIEDIAINNSTGEIFFGTDKGLCSFISDATEPVEYMNSDLIYAYPNPVYAEYDGLITVVGLSYDSDIKITTTNGILVAEGRSSGGTFSWNGRDLNGKKVSSGIYFVQIATSDGAKGAVCKIAFIK